ncbi:type II toxin-antitoxin system VapB family antitoxin [Pseudaminobacter salicylatoxidans]|uniref:type II toxin-antitoxin system VapB family antitoxin n=1 Tax=Pseudaminobacter salicylatoxidans TaxID=93369 RepID=UPI000D6D4709|nr:type II toxin-antitoxin system VapB family antitoxin [Pseudaminobacter salicylatoxidans]
MVIHVKDEKADMLVRRLARSRGIGITEAIREAAEEALAKDAMEEREEGLPLHQRLQPLLSRLDRLPRPQGATDKRFFDDLWGEGG